MSKVLLVFCDANLFFIILSPAFFLLRFSEEEEDSELSDLSLFTETLSLLCGLAVISVLALALE